MSGSPPVPDQAALVVSIHDVSPLTRERTDAMLADLGLATSLLVVPDHHRKAPIAGDAGFGEWLRARAADGHEIVQHGYFHVREPRRGEGPLDRAITGTYTAGEGEFYDLPYEDARGLLARGRAALVACGVEARGFIAPAWLLGREAARAVADEGFLYTTRLGGIERIATPAAAWRSQSLVWSVRAAWRRIVSQAWNASLFVRLRSNRVVRIGLHPPDWDHPAIRAQALKLTSKALAARRAITYEGFVESAVS